VCVCVCVHEEKLQVFGLIIFLFVWNKYIDFLFICCFTSYVICA